MKITILTLIVFTIDLYYCRLITNSYKNAFVFLFAITLTGAMIMLLTSPLAEIIAMSGICDWYYDYIDLYWKP